MNILVSTTTNWNPGDCWILYGVKNILKYIFPFTPNYIHYDRNPNNMIGWPLDQNMKYRLHGTFMNNPIDWGLIDLVVLAGSPEFLHHPLAPIYEGLVDNPHIPLWAIGVGYSEPYWLVPFEESERTVLKRENTLIISRQKELSERLFVEFKREVFTLPCPALFCFEKFPEKTAELCNCPAHSLEELRDNERDSDIFFSSDPYDLLNYIGKHRTVFSTRLHGFIAGVSSGASSKCFASNFRIDEAIKEFNDVVEADSATITAFKVRTLSNYIKIINTYYAKSFTT